MLFLGLDNFCMDTLKYNDLLCDDTIVLLWMFSANLEFLLCQKVFDFRGFVELAFI
jgi:hypothetical protein